MSESWNEKWEIQHRLGEGGQGTVDLVVSVEHRTERTKSAREIVESLEFIVPRARSGDETDTLPDAAEQLANAIQNVTRPPLPSELGALKQLHLLTAHAEREQALKRFGAELQALSELRDQPAILKLLDSNQAGVGWSPSITRAEHSVSARERSSATRSEPFAHLNQ
jgi:hypothetical protein